MTEIDGRIRREAGARVAAVAKSMGASLAELTRDLNDEIADSILELRGDEAILELLRSSTAGNVETFLHVLQHEIPIEQVLPPTGAIEYARRLAQRGISTNALLRAYRIGQNRVLDRGSAEIERTERDREVAFAAMKLFQQGAFAYVDRVAELVVVEYESERERWLANRNTVRAEFLAAMLGGKHVDVTAAETALGYRLRQHHLGLVVWTAERGGVIGDLRQLESVVAEIGDAIGAEGRALFIPKDSGLAWCWIPLGSKVSAAADIMAAAGSALRPDLRLALGRTEYGADGFRATHAEAIRAHAVATAGAASAVTSFADDGVEVASILVRDLDSARSLVARALGALATDDENAERLRETLAVFLGSAQSYVAAAERLYLHKNTVRYRVAKAVELRGRDLDEDRLELELALIACRRLGRAVLLERVS